MAVVVVISRKGGCGKSTLATHIAAYLACQGMPVTLGDLDPQQSACTWLGRRPSSAPAIAAWSADAKALVRPPASAANLVIDTPGGLQGFALSKMVMWADAVVIPVCASAFDRESSAQCWAELRAHPRVKSGRCQVACMGVRLDSRTDAQQVTRDWAAAQGLQWLGWLRSAQVYVRAVENGLSIFDMPLKPTAADRSQWSPLLAWLQPIISASKVEAQEKSEAQFATMQRKIASADQVRPIAQSTLPQRTTLTPDDLHGAQPSAGYFSGWISALFKAQPNKT